MLVVNTSVTNQVIGLGNWARAARLKAPKGQRFLGCSFLGAGSGNVSTTKHSTKDTHDMRFTITLRYADGSGPARSEHDAESMKEALNTLSNLFTVLLPGETFTVERLS